MDFKHWLHINEMASFSMKDRFFVPCNKIIMLNRNMPCDDRPVAAVDMRFEDPGAYPPPYNKMSMWSKFSAQVPGTTQYIVHHGMQNAELTIERNAIRLGYLPLTDQNTVDKTPGATSPNGYVLVPENWFLHAELFDDKYQTVKPALADVNGKRKAFFQGTDYGQTPKNSVL